MSDPERSVRIRVIEAAYKRGFRSRNINPSDQYAPWFREGIWLLEQGQKVTTEDLERADRSGGTDHPDPWF